MSRHLHTPLSEVLDMEVDQFDHWFSTLLEVIKSEAPGSNNQ